MWVRYSFCVAQWELTHWLVPVQARGFGPLNHPEQNISRAKRRQRPTVAIHQSQTVSSRVSSLWPSGDVTAAVLTVSGRPLVTGRAPGLVHLVPHQQWPWNSIRWPHTPLHKQVRAHTLAAAHSDQWDRLSACDTLAEQQKLPCHCSLQSSEINPHPQKTASH